MTEESLVHAANYLLGTIGLLAVGVIPVWAVGLCLDSHQVDAGRCHWVGFHKGRFRQNCK